MRWTVEVEPVTLDGLPQWRHRRSSSVRSSPCYDASSQMGFHTKESGEGGDPHQGVIRVGEVAKRAGGNVSLLCSKAASGGAEWWFPDRCKGKNGVTALQ
jgi:hypothetical protein